MRSIGFLGTCLFLTLFPITACSTLSEQGIFSTQNQKRFSTEAEFRNWFAFYYKDPDPKNISAALKFMQQKEYLQDFPDVAAAFLSRIFEKNPKYLDEWLSEWRPLGPDVWDVVLAALYFANTEESRELFAKNLNRGSISNRNKYHALLSENRNQADLLALEIATPRQVNIMWAAFSASGDARYVKKVIELIRYYGDRNSNLSELADVAMITLTNSAMIHKPVAEICLAENRSTSDPKTRALLKAMFQLIAELSKDKLLPSH